MVDCKVNYGLEGIFRSRALVRFLCVFLLTSGFCSRLETTTQTVRHLCPFHATLRTRVGLPPSLIGRAAWNLQSTGGIIVTFLSFET